MAWGSVYLAERAHEDAIREFRLAYEARPFCLFCPLARLGRAYDSAGQADSAIAVYERYVTLPLFARAIADADYRGFAFERLGALYEERGHADKAVYYYGKLVELWQSADPELEPRVEAARRAIEALSPDR